jgi:hypothetical protein
LLSILDYQYLTAALHTWRRANPWANDIRFENMPERTRDAIILSARLMQQCGDPEEQIAA